MQREFNLIENLKKLLARNHPRTVVPLGDDGFVFKSFNENTAVAQDLMIEDVHFKSSYFSARDLGYKSLAVNLSDLAAMGARPHFAHVSLAVPKNIEEKWLLDFYAGMTELADQHKVEIVGGDLSLSPGPIMIDVNIIGEVGLPYTRHGVQSGDLLAVTGPLGVSHAGMLALQKELYIYAEATQKHLRPKPRLDVSATLRKHQVTEKTLHAMMDCSDGLISDLHRLTRNLELGIDLKLADIPTESDAEGFALSLHQKVQDWVLWGGEDYELLLAFPADKKDELKYIFESEDLDLFIIGKFNKSGKICLIDEDGHEEELKEFKGWSHL
ncbi:MAG: thiamine-phosphate kinase [Bdellovibrionaceae bacterium]|nr:thiamine-phosphate kinase [Pseudobdellovibrionaceae bacterium]